MPIIGIISDTHGRISDDALVALSDADYIIHAGDIGSLAVLNELEAFAPVTAVLGNNDYNVDYGPGVKDTASVTIDGLKIFVSHFPRDAERAADSGDYDLAIHGHTHVPRDEMRGKCRVINPGGAFRPRGGSHRSLVLVQSDGGRVTSIKPIKIS